MKRITYLFIVMFLAAAAVSCSNDEMLQTDENIMLKSLDLTAGVESTAVEYCGTQTYKLTAGRTIEAGSVVISNDASNLYVTVTSYAGFQNEQENIKMWLGTDLSLLNGGGLERPSAGGFPYKTTVTSGNTYTFTVALNAIPFYDVTKCGLQALYAVVHVDALVSDGNGGTSAETAFGGDTPGSGNAWWFYAVYTPQCCETPPPPPAEKLGTAFAKGGYVFTTDKKSNPENLPSLGLTRNRWGWAINLVSPGSYTFDLYVGAGLNFTSKGLKAGTVAIDFDGTQATVTYNLSTGYSIEEAHVYAGDLKPSTIAPGQYGNTYYFDPYATTHTSTYYVSDTNSDGVWFIAHAVAYGTGVTNPM